MKNIILYGLMLFIAGACATRESNHDHEATDHHGHDHGHGDERAAALMAIHDSIMPRMGELMELTEALKVRVNELDSLSKADKKNNYTQKLGTAHDLLQRLGTAEESMMSWMHGYRADTLDKLDEHAAQEYLSGQKIAIMEVQDKMEKSISVTREFLKK